MERLDKNALKEIMNIENEDDLKKWCLKYPNECKRCKKVWYEFHTQITSFIDKHGIKTETKTIGDRKYVMAWHANGRKFFKRKFKDGKLEGKWIMWYDNGNKFYRGEYKDGEKCGIWKSWDIEGNLKSQKDYGPCSEVLSISPRKKNKKAISQKKCAVQGKMQNTITGGCRRKCKIGKEKIGSDGKCTKR